MRDYATMQSTFWTGDTGRQLRGDYATHLLAAYLITCPSSNMIGLYYLPMPVLCHEMGVNEKGACKGLMRLESLSFAWYERKTEWVWVIEMARFQLGTLKAKDKRGPGAARLFEMSGKSGFAKQFHDRYSIALGLPPMQNTEGACKGLVRGMYASRVSVSQEQELDQDLEQEQDLPASPKTNSLGSSDVTYPDGFDSPAVRKSLDEWLAYKRKRGETYKGPESVEKLLKRFFNDFGKSGADKFVKAVDFSIGNNYVGCFPEKDQANGKRNEHPVGPGQHFDGPDDGAPSRYDGKGT